MPNVTATTFTFLGGQLQIGDGGGPENFTLISQVKTCDFSSSKLDTEDVTSADNTDGVKRFSDRLFDPGDLSAEIDWNPTDASHQQLYNAWIARGPHNFKRLNPGGFGTRAFTGIITSLDFKQALDKATTASLKVKLSGPPTSTIPGA